MELKFPIPDELFQFTNLQLYDVRGSRNIEYLQGYGSYLPKSTKIEQNRERRVELILTKNKELDAESLFSLGMSLIMSKDSKDREFKMLYTERYLKAAADQGHIVASYNLGYYYERKYVDNEKEGDYTKNLAKNYYRIAANKGLLVACHNLARLSIGIVANHEREEAVEMFNKSATITNSYSHAYLGLLYINGMGVSKDYHLGAQWLQLASDSGNIIAKGNLGVLYFLGKGVDKDVHLAMQHIIPHATKYFQSRALLAYAYANGIGGFNQDYIKAYMWGCLAMGQASDLCNLLESHLSYAECKKWKDYAKVNWHKNL